MKLRIVAGSHGGRRIETPPGRGTRPTAERVREAWFSALGAAVVGAEVADLFAGSGALGIEALSRGARRTHFVESDGRVVRILKRNLASLALEDRATVIRADAVGWVGRLVAPLDIVLADPPYGSDDGARLLARWRERPFAAQLWLEHDATSGLGDGADWSRRYGDTRISAFHASPDPERANSRPPEGDLG